MPPGRSYNPLCPSTNQKIQNMLDDHNYAEHRRRIKTATPAIDTGPPPTYVHLSHKLKKLQLEEERYAKIMRDNLILLQRMSNILHSRGRFSLPSAPRTISENSYQEVRRPHEILEVMRENRAILDRLTMRSPAFSSLKWQNEWERTEKLLENLARPKKPPTQSPRESRLLTSSGCSVCPRWKKNSQDKHTEPTRTQPQNPRIVGKSTLTVDYEPFFPPASRSRASAVSRQRSVRIIAPMETDSNKVISTQWLQCTSNRPKSKAHRRPFVP